MSQKFRKIRLLKQKLYDMQRQLKFLEKNENSSNIEIQKQNSLQNMNKNKLSEKKNINNKIHYNPTYWGSNPILGEINIYSNSKNKNKNKSKRQNKINLSPRINKLLQKTSNQYYKKYQVYNRENQNPKQRLQITFRKKCQARNKSDKEETPRFKKIRTYETEHTDPILSPKFQKSGGKKIVRKISCSPQAMFTENPNSNPYLYLYSTQPIFLSPKHSQVDRNNSPNIKMILSSSVEDINKIPKEIKGRKHYSRYFAQHYNARY